MPEIIPAVIARNFGELKEKIKLVESLASTVQLDVMDGVFVPNLTWREPADLAALETKLFLEAHLMIAEPERNLVEWLASRVGRIIIHWEALAENVVGQDLGSLAAEVHRVGKEFGVALNPETPIEVLAPLIGNLDLVLLMSVNPGAAGQKFQESVWGKVWMLRQKYPNVKIEVDGGINLTNVSRAAVAGIDFLIVGSAIFGDSNPRAALEEMKKTVDSA